VRSGGSSESVDDDCISTSLVAALLHREVWAYSDRVTGADGSSRLPLTNLLFFCCLSAAPLGNIVDNAHGEWRAVQMGHHALCWQLDAGRDQQQIGDMEDYAASVPWEWTQVQH